MAKLLTVSNADDFRAVQAESLTYQRLLDIQQKPNITPTKA